MSTAWILVALLLVALVVLLVLLDRSRTRGGRLSRRRNAVAQDGERRARDLLIAEGYVILEEQARALWSFWVDGEAVELGLRADLLVERDGERLVAEVKTGGLAPDPTFGPTRRQLLEYQLAFGVEGVLLVDAGAGTVSHIAFDATTSSPPARASPEGASPRTAAPRTR